MNKIKKQKTLLYFLAIPLVLCQDKCVVELQTASNKHVQPLNLQWTWGNKTHILDLDMATYTTICHNICLKTVLYFCNWTVLKVRSYQNIYAEKHGRNVHVHKLLGNSHSE